MDSIWEKDIKLPKFSPLQEDLHTDVLIVGGGLAGLLTAKMLTDAGVDCALVEQNRLLGGVSGRTTAKLTSQHGAVYSKLMTKYGKEKAKLYYQANEKAIDAYRAMARQMDFDFQEQSSYLYQTEKTPRLEAEMASCEQLGIPARWKTALSLPFATAGGICFPHQAQFHPLKLAAQLAEGLKIYENTKALAFMGNRVETPHGNISAENIVITTHFPMLNKHGGYFLKLYQQRSYVIALENAHQAEGMYLDVAENGLSVRTAGQYLLLGGGGHRTGKQGLGWRLPESVAEQYYPGASIAARWATQDCMTLDAMPYIGVYSKSTPHLFVATGFQKWGMSSSMVAATLLTDLLQGKDNPYASLFSPQRSILHKQLLCNGAESITNLLRPSAPRCPHLGCALRWNRAEHSWDCPCHGSRFDQAGKVLNNPATDDIKHLP